MDDMDEPTVMVEGGSEAVEFDEPIEDPIESEPIESDPIESEPAPEPEDEPTDEDSADGDVLEAPEGYQYVTYEGHAATVRLDDITLKHGIPTIVSKEQALTLLTHPFERFTVADAPVPSPDEE